MVQVLLIHFFLLFLLPVVHSLNISWDHQIFVNSKNGVDNQSCLQGDIPCASFNMALRGLVFDSTAIFISDGNYTLEDGIECEIANKHRVAIIGSSRTVIRCRKQSTIIAFILSTNILVESITFDSCGNSSILQLESVLFVKFCHGVMIRHVIAQFSRGFSGIIVAYSDEVTIQSCLIANNLFVTAGIYLTGYNGTYSIINTKIIDNMLQPYPFVKFCPSFLGSAIVLSQLDHHTVFIDSCVISNSRRGFSLVELVFSNIFIRNSSIFSNHYSSVVSLYNRHDDSLIHFADLNMTDSLFIASSHLPVVTTSELDDGYMIEYDVFKLIFSLQYLENISRISIPVTFSIEAVCGPFLRGKCSSDENATDYTGHCPITYSFCLDGGCYCDSNHAGMLCGQCLDGYSVPVNSPYLSCVPCDNQHTVLKDWGLLIGYEFVPLTLLICVVVVFGVNLNQGSLSSYILFSQILTISFPSVLYPSWIVTNFDFFIYNNVYLVPFSIWNLDLINILPEVMVKYGQLKNFRESTGVSICISSSTTPLGAILFWYVISIYPLAVLLFLYSIIFLYNRGHKVLFCLIKPIHRLLARFWRMFNIHQSLTHSVASLYTLCFTQLAATSLKILHPTWYRDESGNVVVAFFYDGSQKYFQGWHIPAVLAAVLVLLVLITITLYLSLYSFQWFQKCLNRLKFKKDFLISVTDVVTAPYKDGTGNTWDYRSFAGIRFILLLVIMSFYYTPQTDQTVLIIPVVKCVTCTLYICTIIIFRPYKKNIHTFTEMAAFAILGLFASSFLFPDPRHPVTTFDENFWYTRLILPVLGAVLLLVVIPYCLVWLVKKFIHCYRYILASKHSKDEVLLQISEDNEELTDELIDAMDSQLSWK